MGSHPGNGSQRLRVVVCQTFKNSSHYIGIRRGGSKSRIESLWQSSVTPAKFLSARHNDVSVVRSRVLRLETTCVRQRQNQKKCRQERHTSTEQSISSEREALRSISCLSQFHLRPPVSFRNSL